MQILNQLWPWGSCFYDDSVLDLVQPTNLWQTDVQLAVCDDYEFIIIHGGFYCWGGPQLSDYL